MKRANNNLIPFFISTVIISWLLWMIVMLNNNKLINLGWINNIVDNLASFTPSLLGIYFVYKENGLKQVSAFIKKGIKFRFKIKYYLMCLIIPLVLAVSYLLSKLIFNFNLENGLIREPQMIPIAFIYILFLGGPLGEEFGWRGYALPRMNKVFKPLYSSIIIGIIWSLWHLPLFFMKTKVQYGINIPAYTIFTILISIIITIIFIKTGGSVLSALLFHTFSNLGWGLFPLFTAPAAGLIALVILISVTIFLTYINRDIMV